ncbi:MAG: M28 family peptidase [Nitrospirota bacterium]
MVVKFYLAHVKRCAGDIRQMVVESQEASFRHTHEPFMLKFIIVMEIQSRLKKTVYVLSQEIGSRGYLQIRQLEQTADYITEELTSYGYDALFQPYKYQGNTYKNIIAEIKGKKTPEKILIVGAHYDTIMGTPGADDNASGVAGMLETARLLYNRNLDKTVRLVAFTLEEPPLFRSRYMGSYQYAKSLRDKNEAIEGMLSLEMIGYFTDRPKSQYFPLPFFKWFYPDKGNFIALVGNFSSKRFISRVKTAFKRGTELPIESLSAFTCVPGVDFSDHRSFWKFNYNALMVTDTAFYRNLHYHGISDTLETIDYARMAEVVAGLTTAIEALAEG